jgi:hypothetical protein
MKEKKPITSGANSGHITKHKQSIIIRCLWFSAIVGCLKISSHERYLGDVSTFICSHLAQEAEVIRAFGSFS